MITLYWLVFYAAISLASIQFVRFAGPLAIGPCYRIEELYDSDSGKLNVAYRILAPTVCCEIPVLALVAACNASNLPGPTLRFLPTALYWLFLGVIKLTNNTLTDRLLPFLGEAFISQLLALAFDHFVIGGYIGSQGVNVFDNSSIAFQFELAIFGVATCWISTLLMRLQAKSHLHSPFPKTTHGGSYYSLVDTTEVKLFSYEREFGELLPQRFTNDILLRSVFFAIMAIEDGNRPSFIRTIERLAARLNLAKTTGIMQQTCAHPLSDRDSVELAIPFLERMWDRYLAEYARSTEGIGDKAIRIYSNYYTYDYQRLSRSICSHFGPFYGDYCGTRLLDASGVLHDVLDFEERQHYCLLPKKVSAPGSICSTEFGWLSGEYCFWSDHETVTSCLAEEAGSCITIISSSCAEKDAVGTLTKRLFGLGAIVLSVKFIEGATAVISCRGDSSLISDVVDEGWRMTAKDN